MQQYLIITTLVLYVAFAFYPLVELPVFSRTLNLSPGNLMTIFSVICISIKNMLEAGNDQSEFRRSPKVTRFIFSYIFLATIFFSSTLLFFILHNEWVQYLPRSVFIFLLWLVAPLLFFYGSGFSVSNNQLRAIAAAMMAVFLAGVIGNIIFLTSGFNLPRLIADMLASQTSRLVGQMSDPNELGTLAAFFSTIGIMGMLFDSAKRFRILFMLFTAGSVLAMLMTQSREALLTLLIATLGIVLSLLKERKYIQAFLIFLGLSFGIVFALINLPRVAGTLSAIDVGDTSYTLSSRDQVWMGAWNIISNNPIGIGFETMYYLTNNTIGQAHNAFLQSAIISGFLGLCGFLVFWLCLFQLTYEPIKSVAKNWLFNAYFVFSVGYLATAMGSDHFITFYTFNAIFFGLLGLVAGAED